MYIGASRLEISYLFNVALFTYPSLGLDCVHQKKTQFHLTVKMKDSPAAKWHILTERGIEGYTMFYWLFGIS